MSTSSGIRGSRRSEPAPHEAEQICRLVVDKSPLPSMVIDGEDLGIVAANDAATRCYGYSLDELLALTARQLRADGDALGVLDLVAGANRGEPIAWVERHRRRDGSVFDVEARLHAVRYADRDAWLAIVADATGSKAGPVASERRETASLFASRLAHDVNTFLTIIQLEMDRFRRALPAGSQVASGIANVDVAARHAATLARQIVELGRARTARPQTLALNSIVVEMLPMLVRVVGGSITTQTTLEAELGTVVADRTHVEQVIMNLVINARDAMPSGGSLRVETKNVEIDLERARALEAEPGAYVALAVADDGIGMDAATAARIFEPFFTTKAPGLGTGLGLSTVAAVAKTSGGAVEVRSEEHRGTTFTIYLPRAVR